MAVRRESVRLDLEDAGFTSGMARAAASTALLNRELNNLDGVSVRANTSLGDAGDGIDNFQKKSTSGGKEVDKLSGRITLLRDALITIGPAAVPIGAVAIPAVLGLTAGLGAAAGAAGVAILAFNGVGDALKSIEAARLEPTVENLEKMHQALAALGPAGADFARYIADLKPSLQELQNTARAGLFPGVEEGIDHLLTLLPQAERIVDSLATEMGKLAEEAGGALAGDGFSSFFDYIEGDGAATLDAFAHSLGNVVEGLANLLVAFAPLSEGFGDGLERMTRQFADWSAGLSASNGFANFVDYVERETPKVLDLLGTMATTFVSIAKAAAPVGDAVLPVLTELLKVLGQIAESPVGPAIYTTVAAMVAFGRATTLANTAMTKYNLTLFKSRAAAIGLGIGVSFLADQVGLSNTALGAQVGILGGPWGVAIGASIGALADLGDHLVHAGDNLNELTAAAVAGSTAQKKAFLEQAEAGKAAADTIGGALGDKLSGEFQNSIDEVTDSLDHGADATDRFRAASARLRDQMVAERNAAKETARAFVGIGDSVNDAKVSLNGWIHDMAQSARDLRQFSQNAQDAADKGLRKGLIKALQEAGPEGARRMAQLADATKTQIAKANAAWHSGQTAVAQYADTVARLNAQINGLHNRTIEINLKVSRTGNQLADIPLPGDAGGSADGSTVPKTGLPYADRHLYLLADGEEVISNRHGQADRHRDLLKAINSNRLAGGGTAGIATYASTKDPLANLAAQFGNLFAGYAADLNQIHQLTLSQLKTAQDELMTRKKLLDQEVERDKALTQATRDAMQSLSDAIAGRFSSFDSSAQSSFGVDANGNLSFNHNLTPGADPNFNTDGVYIGGVPTGAQSYDDFVKAGLSNANDPNAELAQIADTQRYLLQLLQALSGLGASKALLAFAGTNFSLQQLANLVSQGGLGVSQANHLLNQGNALGQQAGDFTANVVYGAKLDEQIKAQHQAIKLQQDTVDAINNVERAIRGQSKKGPGKGSGSGKGSQDQGSSRYADRNADGTTKSHVKSRVRAGAKGYIR